MSVFIPIKKLKELREAAKNGNAQARAIIDKYMDDNPDMESIDRMMDEYYKGASIETLDSAGEGKGQLAQAIGGKPKEPKAGQMPENAEIPKTDPETDPTPFASKQAINEIEGAMENKFNDEGNASNEGSAPKKEEVVEEDIDLEEDDDFDFDMDDELDGLFDDDDFEDGSLSDYIGNKKRDAMRARKGAEYFKGFDPAKRASYLGRRKDEYTHSFDGRRKNIDRKFKDTDSALTRYSQMVTDMADDDMPLDIARATEAYDEFTDDSDAMDAFGRSWDEDDNGVVKTVLESLVARYGKKCVMAMLNTLRDDNSAWQKFSQGKIDNAISTYGKNLDSLLK